MQYYKAIKNKAALTRFKWNNLQNILSEKKQDFIVHFLSIYTQLFIYHRISLKQNQQSGHSCCLWGNTLGGLKSGVREIITFTVYPFES